MIGDTAFTRGNTYHSKEKAKRKSTFRHFLYPIVAKVFQPTLAATSWSIATLILSYSNLTRRSSLNMGQHEKPFSELHEKLVAIGMVVLEILVVGLMNKSTLLT